MTSANLGMIIEILVAMLLVLTIVYCVILNGRLKALRADEHILRQTIGELLSATEVAERAIIGLKATTREAENALGSKLRDAQLMRNELHGLISAAPRSVTPPPYIETQRVAPPTQAAQPALQPPVQSPQLSQAMRELDQSLNMPQQPATPKNQTQDFRVFTRSSFASRG